MSLKNIITGLVLLSSMSPGAAASEEGVLGFTVMDIDGNEVNLEQYRGKALLIVNTASKCGFTYQFEGLESLYQQYKDRGLVVLGFPTNDFLRQDPGTNEEIKEFCTVNFGVTFPMFAKITVKGRKTEPLYDYLISKETNPDFGGKISWNFNKFLIDGEGRVVGRFDSKTEPNSPELIGALEKVLESL